MRVQVFKSFLLAFCLIPSLAMAEIFNAVSIGPGAEIDPNIQKFVFDQTQKNPTPLVVESDVFDENGNWAIRRNELRGVIYLALPEEISDQLIRSIRNNWKNLGIGAHKTNLSFDDNWNPIYDLAVVKGYTDYELLEIYYVSGVNYDITNEKVLSQIRKWQESIDMYFVTFDDSRFEAVITDFKYDFTKLAQENYDLCPDVIEQGYGSMEMLIKGLKESNYLWCWWD